MNKLSPELTRQILDPAMHAKLLLRAAELIELGWTRGTAARDTEGQYRGAEGPVHGAAGHPPEPPVVATARGRIAPRRWFRTGRSNSWYPSPNMATSGVEA